MPKERVFIAVKTYPTLSKKYTELVCTAGFREDGSWIRIYPSPFRFLNDDKRYKKYQWIELDLDKNPKDPRPESFRPRNIDDIVLGDVVPAGGHWQDRRELILKKNTIHTNTSKLIADAKANALSLAIFKPTEILDFVFEPVSPDWEIGKKQIAEEALKQGSLFDETDKPDFKIMPKLPYKFSYRFKDDAGTESKLMIEDWETGMLYWNCLKDSTPEEAAQKVREKYLDDFAKTKDLHFFLGTTYEAHVRKFKNPFVIIGTFHPAHVTQESLF